MKYFLNRQNIDYSSITFAEEGMIQYYNEPPNAVFWQYFAYLITPTTYFVFCEYFTHIEKNHQIIVLYYYCVFLNYE